MNVGPLWVIAVMSKRTFNLRQNKNTSVSFRNDLSLNGSVTSAILYCIALKCIWKRRWPSPFMWRPAPWFEAAWGNGMSFNFLTKKKQKRRSQTNEAVRNKENDPNLTSSTTNASLLLCANRTMSSISPQDRTVPETNAPWCKNEIMECTSDNENKEKKTSDRFISP